MVDTSLIKKDGTFSFFLPLKKSEDASDDRRIVEGIASTEHTDLQNEIVLQKGINIDYFVERGKLNWDHKPGPENIIGEPLACQQVNKGMYVKGMLYKGHPRADAAWSLASAMAKSGSKHGLGFSIQGKVIRKSNAPDGRKVIESCWLQEIAITAHPINTHTYMDIVKALQEEDWAGDFADIEDTISKKSLEIPSNGSGMDAAKVQVHSFSCQCNDCAHERVSKSEAIEYILANYDVSKRVAQILANSAFAVFDPSTF